MTIDGQAPHTSTQLQNDPSGDFVPAVERLGNAIREILHQLAGHLDITAAELPGGGPSRFEGCRDAIARLQAMVSDLTELSAAESLVLQPSAVRPDHMVRRFQDWIALLCERQGVRFQVNSTALPKCVETDPGLVEDILYRLLEQRIAAAIGGEISLAASWDREALVFDILDTGAPIDLDLVASSSGSDDALDREPGHGLWLRIVRKRLAKAGGSLMVLSNSSRGATVRVRIPAGEVEPSDETPARREQAAATWNGEVEPMSLLVAEDSDESFTVFQAYVSDEGHLIHRAHDGREAVDMFKHGHFDMVIMDVQMPAMDGYTATRLIREWETERGAARIPVVLLSSEESHRLTRIGASVGCSGYLTKPTPKPVLLQALRHYGGYEVRAGASRDRVPES